MKVFPRQIGTSVPKLKVLFLFIKWKKNWSWAIENLLTKVLA